VVRSVPSAEIFEELKHKFQVFFLHKPYYDSVVDQQMVSKWESVLGSEHVLHLEDPKAVVDLILGAIALCSRARSLVDYLRDMQDRGQEEKRIGDIQTALNPLSQFLFGGGRDRGHHTSGTTSRSPTLDFGDPPATTVSPKPASSELKQLKGRLEEIRARVTDFPKGYLCPITQDPFEDPVFTVDGHTYERIAIESWLEEHDTSPLTNRPLESKVTIPNHALRNAMIEYIEVCNKKGI